MSTTLPAKLTKTEIPEVYAGKASVYDIWGKLTESNAQDRCLELANIQDGESVLEVAVGTGLSFQRILQQNPNGINEGLDLSPAMLAKAKEKANRTGVKNYNLQLGDAYQLDFADATFDLLINNYMFDLLPESDFPTHLTRISPRFAPGRTLGFAKHGKRRTLVSTNLARHLPHSAIVDGRLSRCGAA